MSETKHTPGELTTRAVADLDFSHEVCAGEQPVACIYEVNGKSNAARIVLTWNCHDELVAALYLLDAYLYAVAPESNERQIVGAALAKAEGRS